MPSRPDLSDANEIHAKDAGKTAFRATLPEIDKGPAEHIYVRDRSGKVLRVPVASLTGAPDSDLDALLVKPCEHEQQKSERLDFAVKTAHLYEESRKHQEQALKTLEQALEEQEGETFLYVVGMTYYPGRCYATEGDKVTFDVSPKAPGVLVKLVKYSIGTSQLGVVVSSQTAKAKELLAKMESQNKLLKGTLVRQIQHNGKTAWKVRVKL